MQRFILADIPSCGYTRLIQDTKDSYSQALDEPKRQAQKRLADLIHANRKGRLRVIVWVLLISLSL